MLAIHFFNWWGCDRAVANWWPHILQLERYIVEENSEGDLVRYAPRNHAVGEMQQTGNWRSDRF